MRSDNNRQHFVDTTELSMYRDRFEPQYLFRVYAWAPKTIQKRLRVDAEFFVKEIDIFAFANLSGYVSTHCTGP